MDYAKQYQEYLVRVNAALETACNTYLPEESDVCRAARYSLLGGGKRIRAVLVLAVCDMLNGDAAAADQFAAAVEMLHCYSLIHDDLPCMDNDDLRRRQAKVGMLRCGAPVRRGRPPAQQPRMPSPGAQGAEEEDEGGAEAARGRGLGRERVRRAGVRAGLADPL